MQSLRVLVVEDSEDDAELMLRQLRRGGYETRFERVENAEAMEAALQKQAWDIVISDYRIPGFGGMDALALFQKKEVDLPFIILSGQIGEDIAVKAMKAGAHDYIMKDNMARLLPAVARELREAAMRRSRKEAERALQESERQLRVLTQELENSVTELTRKEEQLREANRALSESGQKLEQRVQERTKELTTTNLALQNEIGERMRLEKELLDIVEKERQRMGFDLHDDLNQKLLGVLFLVKAMELKVANKTMPRKVEARKIEKLVKQVINHTHNLAHNFSNLDANGASLIKELKGLAANVRKMFQTSCRFSSRGNIPELPQNVAVQMYKIAQEAASNAVKHGRASLISICLALEPGKVVLTITNDGIPFPEKQGETQRMGLRIMNSRASIIGATVDIKPWGSNGTIVCCTLPLLNGAKPNLLDTPAPPNGHTPENGGQLASDELTVPTMTLEMAIPLNAVERNGHHPVLNGHDRNGFAETVH